MKNVSATIVPNDGIECADVLFVFARGSSSNSSGGFLKIPFESDFRKLEEIPGAFFQAMKSNLDRDYPHVTYKAVSVHNFPNLYNSKGYRAVGIFGPTTINNIFEAEISWWPFGEYRDSVLNGVDETVGYVKDQISLCPDQQIVMGGYSQGANVVGDSLFNFTEEERSHISAVSLFGDPKYIGSDTNNSTPIDYLANLFQKPKAKSWKRGTATLVDRGSLDARVPYVPADMDNRVMSWCFNDDFVCTGGSGLLQIFKGSPLDGYKYDKNDLGAGHTRYATFGAPQAASEITQRLAPALQQKEVSKGGVNPNKQLAQPIPAAPNPRPEDVMFMVDVSYGVDDVLGQLRINSTDVLSGFSSFFSDVLYGVGEFNETGSLPNARIPHVQIRQNLTANLDALSLAMNRKLAYGTSSGGGLDAPDPHMLGIERGVMGVSWRQPATKHLVIITDRPSLTSYTYNMCDSAVRTGFGIDDPNQCMVNPSLETASANLHPERCVSAYQVLASATCTLFMTSPYYIYNVTRTIDDAVRIAQAKGVTVSFVVPHAYQPSVDKATADTQLRTIATSTGGLFLSYDAFTRASYTDAVWRVLNQKPKLMTLSMLGDFDNLGASEKLQQKNIATTKTNAPTLLDVTAPNIFDEYKWDFNGDGAWDEATNSPTNEHVFTAVSNSTFVTAAGFNGGIEQSRVTLPLSVVAGDLPPVKILPPTPEGANAVEKLDSTTEITWSIPSEPEGVVMFIGDPQAHLPIFSAPASRGNVTLPDGLSIGSQILVWFENIDGASEKLLITVTVEQPALPPPSPNQTVDPDPIVVEPPADPPIVVVEDGDTTPEVIVDQPDVTPPEVIVDDPDTTPPDVVVEDPSDPPAEDTNPPNDETPPVDGDTDTPPENEEQPPVDNREPTDKVINESNSWPDLSGIIALTRDPTPTPATPAPTEPVDTEQPAKQSVVEAAGFTQVKAAEDVLTKPAAVSPKLEVINDSISPTMLVVIITIVFGLFGVLYDKVRKRVSGS